METYTRTEAARRLAVRPEKLEWWIKGGLLRPIEPAPGRGTPYSFALPEIFRTAAALEVQALFGRYGRPGELVRRLREEVPDSLVEEQMRLSAEYLRDKELQARAKSKRPIQGRGSWALAQRSSDARVFVYLIPGSHELEVEVQKSGAQGEPIWLPAAVVRLNLGIVARTILLRGSR